MKKTFLKEIIEKKSVEIKHLYKQYGINYFKANLTSEKPLFKSAIKTNKLNLIAEVKKASPSKGIIRSKFNPLEVAKEFKKKNASALSILTEKNYFLGDPNYIPLIKKAIDLPILRKDFIIDPIQVYESKKLNADAILLIKSILSIDECKELINIALDINLDILMEIHNLEEWNEIKYLNPNMIIGINNRDLKTFETDINTTLNISKQIRNEKPNQIIIAESGYSKIEELEPLKKENINAVLIGEGLAKYPMLLESFNED